ncbi:MAG TPA: bifunctional 2-polyprenyl-6-hydroxyphenol methylase/3-demethylubiquinol 3-O-methyltransferase UbiG [Alphaproteobacteria bacterium]
MTPFLHAIAGFNQSSGAPSFGDHAAKWWDSDGPMAPLHRLNPVRLDYVKEILCAHFNRDADQPQPLKGLRLLDIGCGGGLMTEPLTRLGADITGIDASAELIAVARKHAQQQGLTIDYQDVLSSVLVKDKQKFDAVLALEVIEHVDNPAELLADINALLKKNGVAILSTLNRTAKSFLGGIVAAEYLLRWVPRGTHAWDHFMKPSELATLAHQANLNPVATMGLHYQPLQQTFTLQADKLDINYFMVLAHA